MEENKNNTNELKEIKNYLMDYLQLQGYYNPDILIESRVLSYKVEDCFCPRTSNALRCGRVGYNIPREPILTIKDLIMHSEKELSKYRNLGPKGIKEIKVWLEAHNLKL